MRFILFLAIVVTPLACKPTRVLDKRIVDFAKDQIISEDEINDLKIIAAQVPSLASDDSIDADSKLRKYVRDFLKIKGLQANIWEPVVIIKPFNLNVYLENSASMDGYVRGVTQFETAIYNMLGDFKISSFIDSLNLFYINNTIPYSKVNALAPDIEDFIEKLEPSIFRERGGKRSTSDIKNILKMVLDDVDSLNIAILISDFVFSPGSAKNAAEYVNNQSIGVKIDVSEKLKSLDLSIVILRMNSQFDGLYYDMFDRPIQYKGNRPYYIWFIGSDEQIQKVTSSGIIASMRGGYSNMYLLRNSSNAQAPSYKIKMNPRVGQFRLENGATQISRAKSDGGNFMFQLMVNLSNTGIESSYLSDASNYRVNLSNYSIEVSQLTGTPGFTHLMTLRSDHFKPESVTIELLAEIPSWVEHHTTFDDTNTVPDTDLANKTFGLYALIEGVHDAFYPVTTRRSFLSFTIPIK